MSHFNSKNGQPYLGMVSYAITFVINQKNKQPADFNGFSFKLDTRNLFLQDFIRGWKLEVA